MRLDIEYSTLSTLVVRYRPLHVWIVAGMLAATAMFITVERQLDEVIAVEVVSRLGARAMRWHRVYLVLAAGERLPVAAWMPVSRVGQRASRFASSWGCLVRCGHIGDMPETKKGVLSTRRVRPAWQPGLEGRGRKRTTSRL
jgi:hypothetical protein